MDNRIGWKFPLTGGGESKGFKDSGISYFKGDRFASLARETIQNSLDACKNDDKPVLASFELIKIDNGSAFGQTDLIETLEACVESEDCKEEDRAELESALKALKTKSVNCLRISDRNTTGLQGKQWRALVKASGLVEKSKGAGGSYGIGKAAPFVVTPIRTVFYWTHYVENGKPIEKFQGKAVLMSHNRGEGETQGTGYYGVKDGCKELTGEEIPSDFRLLKEPNSGSKPIEGTALHILGFSAEGNWRMRIAESVIANYFYAFDNKKLKVSIEPNEEMERRGLLEINAETIDDWFKYLDEDRANDSNSEAIEDALALRQALKEDVSAEKQDKDLGHCKLWIKVSDELPSKVGFVRRSGMLITTEQSGLIRFRSCRNFAALCLFEDPEGNELLRKMENPQHNQFEPDRINDNKEKERGRRALNRITKWIRDEIKKHAGLPEGGQKTMLSELASYLPDHDPEEAFDTQSGEDGGSKEPAFAGKITLKRTRRFVPRRSLIKMDDPDGANGGEEGDEGGRSEERQSGGGNSISDGTGEGEGVGGTGSRGGGGAAQASNSRIKCPHPGDLESSQLLSYQVYCRGERHGAFASARGGRFRSGGMARYSLHRSKQPA